MNTKIVCALLSALLLIGAAPADAAKKKSGGLIGNSYASTMEQIDDTTLRITTRKKVSGDLSEINKPGTTAYNAFQSVQQGATVRAALEAKNLGFDVYKVVGVRSLTQNPEQLSTNTSAAATRERRNASGNLDGNGLSESSFTFAQGHYTTDVEVAIEMTVKLVSGAMPENATQEYVDVDKVLTAYGLNDAVPAQPAK